MHICCAVPGIVLTLGHMREQSRPCLCGSSLPHPRPSAHSHSPCCPAERHGPSSQECSLPTPSSPSLSLSTRSACTAEPLALPLDLQRVCRGPTASAWHLQDTPWAHSDVLLFLLCLKFLTSSSQRVTTLCHRESRNCLLVSEPILMPDSCPSVLPWNATPLCPLRLQCVSGAFLSSVLFCGGSLLELLSSFDF